MPAAFTLSSPWPSRARHAWAGLWRTLRLGAPQLACCALLFALVGVAGWLQTAASAFVAGCNLWGRAHSEAVTALLDYADRRDNSLLRDFEAALAVPNGDRAARLALSGPDPDYDIVERGFVQGGNRSEDVPGMVALFRGFGWHPAFARAVHHWGEGDAGIVELQALAARMRVAADDELPGLRRQVRHVDVALAAREREFASEIQQAAGTLRAAAWTLQSLVAVLLVTFGLRVAASWQGRAHRARRELADLRQRLSVTSTHASTAAWDMDLRRASVELSGALAHSLVPRGARGLTWIARRLHPGDRCAARQGLARLRAGDVLQRLRLRLRMDDGRYRWFDVHAWLHGGRHGRDRRFLGAISDVTALVEAEQGRGESERLARALLDASSDAVIVLNDDGTVVSANRAVQRLLGVPPRDLVGRSLPDMRIGLSDWASLEVRRYPLRHVAQARRADGSDFAAEVSTLKFMQHGSWYVAAFLRDITDKQEAQRRYQQARSLLESSQALARVGGCEEVFEHDSVASHWTGEMFKLLEIPRGDATATPPALADFVAPEFAAAFAQARSRELGDGAALDLELVMVTARGRRFWVHCKSQLWLHDGRLRKRTTVLRDITLHKTSQQAQKQAWALQRRTSEQLELALRGAQIALWAFELRSGTITHAQRWEVFGYSRVPHSFEDWQGLVHPDDLEARLCSMDRYFMGDAEFDDCEFRMRNAAGAWVWVRARGQVVRSTRGDQLQYGGVMMDVSAQVQAREVVREQTRFMQAMVDGIDTGVVVTDDDAIVYMNGSLCRMLGYAAGDAMQLHGLADLFPPEDHAQELERRAALARGAAVPVALCRLLARGDELLRVALNTSRVTWNGRDHYITAATPLSEHDMLEAQIRATQSRFERVLITELEAQQAHIASELHDSLGSELAALSMVLGAARSAAAQSSAETRRYLDTAVAQVKSAVDVTRGLARGLTPVGETPGALVRALERLHRDYSVVKGVQCSLVLDGEHDAIGSEAGNHVYRIAQEALANAVRHGDATVLEIALSSHGGEHRLCVRDNGCGFHPRQLDESRSGLGVRSMMARAKFIGGRLQFDRTASGGTEVCVLWRQPLSTAT